MSDSFEAGASLRRREFLIAGAAVGAATAVPLNYAAVARSAATPVAKNGKFAHGVYRVAALLKWAVERRQPNRLQLGTD